MGTKLDRGDGEHYPCPGLDEGGAYLVPLFRTFVLRDLRKIPGFQFFFRVSRKFFSPAKLLLDHRVGG